jgi:hypothetical protein
MNLEAISLAEEAMPKVKLHATAVFVILNHFVRRSDKDARVLGTNMLIAELFTLLIVAGNNTNLTFHSSSLPLHLEFIDPYLSLPQQALCWEQRAREMSSR